MSQIITEGTVKQKTAMSQSQIGGSQLCIYPESELRVKYI